MWYFWSKNKNRIEFRSRFWERFWPPRGTLQGKKHGFSLRCVLKIEGRPFGAQVPPRTISEAKMKPKRSQNGAHIDQKSIKIRGRISEGKNDAADALRGRLWSPKWTQNGVQNQQKIIPKTDSKTEGPECSRRRSVEVRGGPRRLTI